MGELVELGENYEFAIIKVRDELLAARKRFAPMHGKHEGYGVLLEEVDELWDEVKAKQSSKEKMRNEAKQVAAMAIAFMVEVCGE